MLSKLPPSPLIFYQQILNLHFLISRILAKAGVASYTALKNEQVYWNPNACLKIPQEVNQGNQQSKAISILTIIL